MMKQRSRISSGAWNRPPSHGGAESDEADRRPRSLNESKYNQKSMSFYKSHAPKHREHTREVKLPELEGMKALREEAQDSIAAMAGRSAARQGIRPGMRRFHRGQNRDQLFSARRAAALVRHQHVPEDALPGGRAQGGRIRRSLCRRAFRHRHHLPRRHALRPARNPPHLVACTPPTISNWAWICASR